MESQVVTPHIWLDKQDRPWIDDTNTKVVEVVLDHLAYGWTVEEMHENHPHLSLAQLHAAMGYYFDHKSYFDAEIERIRKSDRTLAEAQKSSPVIKKLQSLGKL